jgi:hypothetical protein
VADGLDTLTGSVGSGCLCSVPLQDLQRKVPTRLFYSLVPNEGTFVSLASIHKRTRIAPSESR